MRTLRVNIGDANIGASSIGSTNMTGQGQGQRGGDGKRSEVGSSSSGGGSVCVYPQSVRGAAEDQGAAVAVYGVAQHSSTSSSSSSSTSACPSTSTPLPTSNPISDVSPSNTAVSGFYRTNDSSRFHNYRTLSSPPRSPRLPGYNNYVRVNPTVMSDSAAAADNLLGSNNINITESDSKIAADSGITRIEDPNLSSTGGFLSKYVRDIGLRARSLVGGLLKREEAVQVRTVLSVLCSAELSCVCMM